MPELLHCPICHETGKHADRCPGREPEKAPEPQQSKLEATADEWMGRVCEDIPKPQKFGFKPRLPVQDSGGVRLLGPDGHPIGMQSQIVVDKSSAEIAFEAKRAKEPCFSCEFWDADGIPEDERVKLFDFLAREAKMSEDALKLVLDLQSGGNPNRIYGWCEAHQQAAHREASCLRLYQPRKGWLKSVAGHLWGGSKKYGF